MEIEMSGIRSPLLWAPAGVEKKEIFCAKRISFDILLLSLIPLSLKPKKCLDIWNLFSAL